MSDVLLLIWPLENIDRSYCWYSGRDQYYALMVWVLLYSELLQVQPDELKSLLSRYANIDELAMNGVTVGGVRYMFLSSTDRVVRAKKGTSGVHCIKTVQGESE